MDDIDESMILLSSCWVNIFINEKIFFEMLFSSKYKQMNLNLTLQVNNY